MAILDANAPVRDMSINEQPYTHDIEYTDTTSLGRVIKGMDCSG